MMMTVAVAAFEIPGSVATAQVKGTKIFLIGGSPTLTSVSIECKKGEKTRDQNADHMAGVENMALREAEIEERATH